LSTIHAYLEGLEVKGLVSAVLIDIITKRELCGVQTYSVASRGAPGKVDVKSCASYGLTV